MQLATKENRATEEHLETQALSVAPDKPVNLVQAVAQGQLEQQEPEDPLDRTVSKVILEWMVMTDRQGL